MRSRFSYLAWLLVLFTGAGAAQLANPVAPTPDSLAAGKRAYDTYCAACHGANGQGDGFNAAFLPKKPTAHANAAEMSRRPDDTLYDAIHSGGSIVNKSHLMPQWGQSLSSKEIRDLVTHIRSLCQCEGPPWSRDNAK